MIDNDYLERRLRDLEQRVQMMSGRIEGISVRVDRMVGGLTDLLARFEAWKTIGNEMGELVKELQGRQGVYDDLWKTQQRANLIVSDFMEEIKALLESMKGPAVH